MAKKEFKKGIDRLFSSTIPDPVESIPTSPPPTTPIPAPAPVPVPVEEKKIKVKEKAIKDQVNYNIRYSAELHKKIKQFCIKNPEYNLKEVFTQGAKILMKLKTPDF